MEQYLYRIQPVRPQMLTEGPTADEERIVGEHFSYLKNLIEKGTLILAGRTLNTDNSSFGICIFKANSIEEANEIVSTDPAVKNHVMKAELYPYRIALLKAENV